MVFPWIFCNFLKTASKCLLKSSQVFCPSIFNIIRRLLYQNRFYSWSCLYIFQLYVCLGIGSSLFLTFLYLQCVWIRCLVVLSAYIKLLWLSDRINWALFSLLGHHFQINIGWPQVHTLWCSVWLNFLLLEGVF